jgi:hypothetical protein
VLSEANVIIALTIYAVAIMVRTVADAFSSIEPQALRSATALGYAEWGRFFRRRVAARWPGVARRIASRGGQHREFGDGGCSWWVSRALGTSSLMASSEELSRK